MPGSSKPIEVVQLQIVKAFIANNLQGEVRDVNVLINELQRKLNLT
jgi:hypothetical protein